MLSALYLCSLFRPWKAWLEHVTYQLKTMDHAAQVKHLAGPIALLKAQCTQTFEFCAREAAQIFGGLACKLTMLT